MTKHVIEILHNFDIDNVKEQFLEMFDIKKDNKLIIEAKFQICFKNTTT